MRIYSEQLSTVEYQNRLNSVIQTIATANSEADFMITHAPFKAIHTDDHTIDEDTLFRDYLVKDGERELHKFFLIEGGSGSGKSHLIRWLYEKYIKSINPQHEAVLMISKAHNNLTEAVTQLLKSGYFPEDVVSDTFEKMKSSRGNLSEEDFKKLINFNFQLAIERDTDTVEPSKLFRDRLDAYLKNEIVLNKYLLRDGGPLDKMHARCETTGDEAIDGDAPIFEAEDFNISHEDYKTISHDGDRKTIAFAEKLYKVSPDEAEENRKAAADYLNSLVSEVASGTMNLNSIDFKGIFLNLRRDLKMRGMNLSLFIEDINAFTGIDKALMDSLIIDNRDIGFEDCCRLLSVVGSTTGYNIHYISDSFRGRITNIFSIDENSVLSDDNIGSFVARYINAINLREDAVSEWFKNMNFEDYPVFVPQNEYDFSTVTVDGMELSIFPFSETALKRLFNTVKRHNIEKTPRVLLKNILYQVLSSWYVRNTAFLTYRNTFSSDMFDVPDWKDETYKTANTHMGDKEFERGLLFRIWGDGTTDICKEGEKTPGVPEKMFKVFDIPVSKDIAIATNHPPIHEEQTHHLPVQIDEGFKRLKNEISTWESNPDAKLSSHSQLRDWMCKFIQQNFPWQEYGIPYSLSHAFTGRAYFCIEGQSAEYTVQNPFILKRSEESKYLLLALASCYTRSVGAGSWAFENGLDYYTVAISWLEKYRDAIYKTIAVSSVSKTAEGIKRNAITALLYSRLISDGLDLTKNDEDIMIEALSSPPSYLYQMENHGPQWRLLFSKYKDINETNDIYIMTRSYFEERVGTAHGSNYTFLDSYEILKIIKVIRNNNWDTEVDAGSVQDSSDVRCVPVKVIQLFKENWETITKEERHKLSLLVTDVESRFVNGADTVEVKRTLDEMASALRLFNIPYDPSKFETIKYADLPVKVKKTLTSMKQVLSSEGIELISMVSGRLLDDAADISRLLSNCEAFLDRAIEQFSTADVSHDKVKIEEYTATVKSEASEMMQMCQKLRGAQ